MTPLHSDVEDRIELRALVEQYARAVDAKDTAAVVALFTDDGRLLSHLLPGTENEPLVRHGREDLRRSLDAGLAQYVQTTHVIGGQVLELEGPTATGSTLCLAHHVYRAPDGSGPRLLVMAIRYEDRYVHHGGLWRFAERRLRLDWRDDRPLVGL